MITEMLRTGFGYWQPFLMVVWGIFTVALFVLLSVIFRIFLPKNDAGDKVSRALVSQWEKISQEPELDSSEVSEGNPYFRLLSRLDSNAFGIQVQIFCVILFIIVCVALWG